MKNKLQLFIIFVIFIIGLFLANNVFDFKAITGNSVNTNSEIEITEWMVGALEYIILIGILMAILLIVIYEFNKYL